MSNRPVDIGPRLIMPGPYEDESISSICDRASALYRINRHTVVHHLTQVNGKSVHTYGQWDWDNPSPIFLRALESTLGADPGSLDSHVIVDGPAWLARTARQSYCPMCFDEDIKAGRCPYFRRAWSRVACTICPSHACPLYIWSSRSLDFDIRQLPLAWLIPAAARPQRQRTVQWDLDYYPMGHPTYDYCANGSPASEQLTQRIIDWESTMQTSLHEHGHPLDYDVYDYDTKTTLMIALSVVNSDKPNINKSLGCMRVINGRWYMAYDTDYLPHLGNENADGWLLFRRMASPARRRAAFVMTACTMEPGWPVDQFMSHTGKAPSGSPDWWHHVVMPYQQVSSYPLFDSIREALSIPALPPKRSRIYPKISKAQPPPPSHAWKMAKMRS
jgi:hypothetical protein